MLLKCFTIWTKIFLKEFYDVKTFLFELLLYKKNDGPCLCITVKKWIQKSIIYIIFLFSVISIEIHVICWDIYSKLYSLGIKEQIKTTISSDYIKKHLALSTAY